MSLIVVGYSALFGAWQESRHKRVHVPAALVFSLTGMIGAWVGAQGQPLVPEALVLFLFGNLLLFISVWTFWKNYEGEQNDIPTGCAKEIFLALCVESPGVRMGSGPVDRVFLELEEDFSLFPALMFLMGFPIRLAIGTSLLIIALISIGGVIGHLKAGTSGYCFNGIGVTRQSSRTDVWSTTDSIHSFSSS